MSAHWAGARQNVLEEGGGIHTAVPVAPMLCGEVADEDDDEEVFAAPSAALVTLAVGAQAFHLLAWAWTDKKGKRITQYYKTKKLHHKLASLCSFLKMGFPCAFFLFMHVLPIIKEFIGMVQSAHGTRR